MRVVPFLGLAAVCMSMTSSCSSDSPPTSYPVRLAFAGVGKRGIFDASLARAPDGSRVWMSYSAVDPSVMWPTQNLNSISTRLAYSDDQGASWTDSGATVNPVRDVDLSGVLAPPNNAGTWVSEVSGLVYDPAASASQRWKLIWHHYLLINEVRQFNHGWLGLKMASDPSGIAAATEVKLFSGVAYDTVNNTAGGVTQSPLGGAPAIALDQLDPALNGCVFTEPGFLATANALYLSLLCAKSTTNHQIAIFKCAAPCSITSTVAWSYLGAALVDADAAALGFDQGFSAPSLVASGGKTYLIATPVSSTPFDAFYNGCRVFEFQDLDAAMLARDSGVLRVVTRVDGNSGTFNGACSFDPTSTGAGVVYGQLFLNESAPFALFLSGVQF